ncbi:MAG: transglutaminase domain-containing protein [Hamadaea sp.]|uniref:transglutaminase-like domain-containing protein n=1 Tax=Hamadaea sp. TaxID=2024425 RepID=UPI00185D1AB4|nr:transglutaminase-like domain-containing protein [Hamadaea sp.]NUR71865.1 transglutaminase domain-containing protein [Hamadaea sp.]NUT19885.1 transglutaminase domain-containing protein [Hamadaea sp.]
MSQYASHSAYSDPGRFAKLLDELPADLPGLTAAVRNTIIHYRHSGEKLPDEHFMEINNRWVERILETDQQRHPYALTEPREVTDRVLGCCRDYTLLTVAALRQHGIPARSRIGFASYFREDYLHDHVVVEYWNGERWVWLDNQLDPADWPSLDVHDLPRPATGAPFVTAAEAWTAYRRGETDPWKYGIGPGQPIGGPWFLFDYVLIELAHRQREEILLWDGFGMMSGDFADEVSSEDPRVILADEIAALLIAADNGSEEAERELSERFAADDRLHPRGRVICHTPDDRGIFAVDLTTRKVETVSAATDVALNAA